MHVHKLPWMIFRMNFNWWLLLLLCLAVYFFTVDSTAYYKKSNYFVIHGDHANKTSSISDWNNSRSLENMMSDEEEITYQEKFVIRGQKVTLDCNMMERKSKNSNENNNMNRTVRWFHNNKVIFPDMRIHWDKNGRLEISHAVSVDSGIWKCFMGESPADYLRLIVTIPPEHPFLVYGGAQLATGARLTTREGNSLTLLCVVEGGNPASHIKWFLNEVDITHDSNVKSEWRGPDKQFTTVSNVTLLSVAKEHHNSNMICIATHPALPASLQVVLRLNIEYPPNFRLRRWPSWGLPVKEGSAVSLLCLVDSNPASPPVWVKELKGRKEELSMSDGWLNLTEIASSDRGWYKCTTIHKFGHFASHSIFINVVQGAQVASPRVVKASLGGAVHIPCMKAGTSSSICWTKTFPDGQQEDTTAKKSQPAHAVKYADSDLHRCDNEDGKKLAGSEETKFVTSGLPSVKPVEPNVLAFRGDSSYLSAIVCSQGKTKDITWLPPSRKFSLRTGKDYGRYQVHSLKEKGNSCWVTNVTVTDISDMDVGSWVVLAINEKGIQAAQIYLNITSTVHSAVAAKANGNKTDLSPLLSLILQVILVTSFIDLILKFY